MEPAKTPSRTTVAAAGYVLAVGVLAGAGFWAHTPWPVLLAAVLTLPASAVTVPGYYLLYGLLGQLPGANPSHSSGFGSSDGTAVVTSGAPAAWFLPTVHALGVVALVLGAVVNVLLARRVLARRHAPQA